MQKIYSRFPEFVKMSENIDCGKHSGGGTEFGRSQNSIPTHCTASKRKKVEPGDIPVTTCHHPAISRSISRLCALMPDTTPGNRSCRGLIYMYFRGTVSSFVQSPIQAHCTVGRANDASIRCEPTPDRFTWLPECSRPVVRATRTCTRFPKTVSTGRPKHSEE